jgi:predicted O-methyltransferase YrrM
VKCEDVDRRLAELDYQPLTSQGAGRLLYDFVLHSDVQDVLELGFAHGTSTAYLAAALHEKGVGRVTTIDRRAALSREPNIHGVLRHLGLEAFVRPVFAERSYNWELLRLLEGQTSGDQTTACFDFCFFDGAHTWETDGFAFYLVDKLLRDDRWILFDDLHWSYAASPTSSSGEMDELPEEERTRAQLELVFDLLVRNHASYERFRVLGNYAWAYKRGSTGSGKHADLVDRLVAPALMRELASALGRPNV